MSHLFCSIIDELGKSNTAGFHNQCHYLLGYYSDIDVLSDYGGGNSKSLAGKTWVDI